jgi:hypothetical protein
MYCYNEWYVNNDSQVVILDPAGPKFIYEICVIYSVNRKEGQRKVPSWAFNNNRIYLDADGMNFGFDDAQSDMQRMWPSIQKNQVDIKSRFFFC